MTTTTPRPPRIDIRALRRELELRQLDVAKRLHCSVACLSRWERGKRRLHVDDAERVVAALRELHQEHEGRFQQIADEVLSETWAGLGLRPRSATRQPQSQPQSHRGAPR